MESTQRFGAYEVTLLLDGVFEAPVDILTHRDGEAAGARARAEWGRPRIPLDVNCFALRGPDGITLIDTGCGLDWGPDFGRARDAMRAAGLLPQDVRRVLLTHVHSDHAYGLLDAEASFFPVAEVHAPEADLAYLADPAARAAASEASQAVFALGDRLARAYAGRLHGFAPGEVLPGIEARALPGHTPGHSGFLIADPAHSLLVWGDLLHVNPLQVRDPRVGVIWDLDPDEALRSRSATLEAAAEAGWRVAGSHVHGFGTVVRDGGTFEIAPA